MQIFNKIDDLIFIRFPIIFPLLYYLILTYFPNYEIYLILIVIFLLAEPHFAATWPIFIDTGNKEYLKQKDLTHAVKWEHQPNHANIHHYFQLSDIFISLSDFCGETFGLTIMEAMCCGLPAIVSNFAGYKQHLKDEDTGFYVNTYHSII